MDEKVKELLGKVVILFKKYGIKSLTMDDIARHLHISKKTLYQFVKDKNDLVKKTVEIERWKDECCVGEFFKKEQNAIDQLFLVSSYVSGKFKDVHPSIFYDLQKYHPGAWGMVDNYKRDFIYKCLYENTKQGIKEGFYRDDIDPDLAARFWLARVDDMINSDLFPPDKFDFQHLYVEMFRHHIRGIASEKGVKYLVKKIQELKEENSDK